MAVVGILKKTNTNYDNVVFTQIDTIWKVHGLEFGEEHHEEEHEGEDAEGTEEHSHGTLGVTAILLKTKSIQAQSEIIREYNKKHNVQAITPTEVLRKSLESIDMSKQIVFALTGIIFVMSVVLLFIITLLTAQDLRNDIRLMRLLGVSPLRIKSIFLIQSGFVSIISLAVAFICSHIALYFVNGISTGYGIVINPLKIYANEYMVLGIMFIVTLLPILLYMAKFFKKDITKI